MREARFHSWILTQRCSESDLSVFTVTLYSTCTVYFRNPFYIILLQRKNHTKTISLPKTAGQPHGQIFYNYASLRVYEKSCALRPDLGYCRDFSMCPLSSVVVASLSLRDASLCKSSSLRSLFLLGWPLPLSQWVASWGHNTHPQLPRVVTSGVRVL